MDHIVKYGMTIKELLNKKKRIFIIPLDHPEVNDTPKLISIGKQNFVDSVDHLNHDGYIFHSYEYFDKPIKTTKDFFLTVGELPDKYLCPFNKLEKFPNIKNVTIFFETENEFDQKPYDFYKKYVRELKKGNYFVMAMAYPKIKNDTNYQHIIDIVNQLNCDAIKTDYYPQLINLNLYKLRLFIAGGEYISNNKDFKTFVKNVEKLKTASCSFGRNIFESENPKQRINFILSSLT